MGIGSHQFPVSLRIHPVCIRGGTKGKGMFRQSLLTREEHLLLILGRQFPYLDQRELALYVQGGWLRQSCESVVGSVPQAGNGGGGEFPFENRYIST